MSKIRIGWFLDNMQKPTDTGFERLHGVPERGNTKNAIKARTSIAHEGHWKLDTLFAKHGVFPDYILELFPITYGVPHSINISPFAMEIVDMNATMVSCLAGTRFSYNSSQDRAFSTAFHSIRDKYNQAKRKLGNDFFALDRALRSDQSVLSLRGEMERIMRNTSRTHREHLRTRRVAAAESRCANSSTQR